MTDESSSAVRPYTVMVGVSATSKSPKALEWGAAQAELLGGRLIAVRLWRPQAPPGTTATVGGARVSPTQIERAERQSQLEDDIRAVLGDGHQAQVLLLRAGKRRGLVEAAKEADLLVMDAPRRVSRAPLLAQRVIQSSSCPVVVMPPSIQGADPTLTSRAGHAFGRAMVAAAGRAGRPGYRPPSHLRE